MWDDYHVFLILTLVFTRLLLDEIYHLIELPFGWLFDDAMFDCLLDELILGFSYSDLAWETGGFELPSTITLVLQANRLTKCANHQWSNALWYVKVYIFWKCIQYIIHWDKTKMLKNVLSDKISGTKNALFFLSRVATNHSFTFNFAILIWDEAQGSSL